jgi:predicted porin
MHRFLLRTTMALGVIGLGGTGIAPVAFAQMAYPQTPTPTGPNQMWGVSGLAAPPAGASSVAASDTAAPGSFGVHLNGRLNYYLGAVGSSVDQFDGSKLDNVETQGYLRLYPGFDAVAANGLQYGVVSEIRNPGSNFTGVGVNASGNASQNTLFWYEAYGYVGAQNLGLLYFGQSDGAFDLLMVGTFENFNDGGWNGDVPGFIPSAAAPIWPWPDSSPYQTINRLTYLSPTWDGLQFGVSFAPNNTPLINAEGCNVAAANCNRLASTPLPADGSVANSPRYRNIVDAAAEYTGTFGPIGINASIGYLHSTPVSNSLAGAIPFSGLSVGMGGLTLTYGGVTVGGNILGGTMNNAYFLQPKDGADALAFLIGGSYSVGPVVVGASYYKYKYQGDFQSPATEGVETDQGIAAGGTYAVAPGLALYLSYLYGTRHQLGFDFATNAPGTAFNNVKSQVFAVGTVWKW